MDSSGLRATGRRFRLRRMVPAPRAHRDISNRLHTVSFYGLLSDSETVLSVPPKPRNCCDGGLSREPGASFCGRVGHLECRSGKEGDSQVTGGSLVTVGERVRQSAANEGTIPLAKSGFPR